MIKKGSVLLLVLLLSLPGCQRKDKKMEGRRGRDVAHKSDDFKTVNLALADKDLAVDESMKSFFDDMEEFVSFAQEGDDFALVEANEGSPIKQDEFAWKDTQDGKKFETVYFGFNKNKVDKVEREKVAQNVEKVKELVAAGTAVKIVVEGHACASAGSDAYNLALSEQRAKEVRDQLVAAGIAQNQIKIVGRGTGMLVVKDGGREEQWPNRRVEIHVA